MTAGTKGKGIGGKVARGAFARPQHHRVLELLGEVAAALL
jgi:hypothetical protein